VNNVCRTDPPWQLTGANYRYKDVKVRKVELENVSFEDVSAHNDVLTVKLSDWTLRRMGNVTHGRSIIIEQSLHVNSRLDSNLGPNSR